jgi:hypothetical protein
MQGFHHTATEVYMHQEGHISAVLGKTNNRAFGRFKSALDTQSGTCHRSAFCGILKDASVLQRNFDVHAPEIMARVCLAD